MIPAWTNEAKELKRQRAALERDVNLVLQSLRKDVPGVVSELESFRHGLDADCAKERGALLQQADRLKVSRSLSCVVDILFDSELFRVIRACASS